MGFFKILGGAALAVAAIVAAPVFGAVGTITAVGAVVGAAVGAAAGGVASAMEEQENGSSEREAYERGKAERAAEVHDLQSKLQAAARRFNDYKAYEEFLVAAFAVAIAAANADGIFTDEERAEIEEIVSGESYRALPEGVRNQIGKLYSNPPNFATAMEFVRRVDKSEWGTFDDIVELVIARNGTTPKANTAFRQAWQEFKAS